MQQYAIDCYLVYINESDMDCFDIVLSLLIPAGWYLYVGGELNIVTYNIAKNYNILIYIKQLRIYLNKSI